MNLFELVASVTLDTSGFTGGISDAMGAFNGLKNLVGKGLQIGFDFAKDFAKDVVDTGIGFDRQMSAVQAVLGKEEATEENMAELRALALDQARQSVFTAEEMADAYYYMGMAGWKSEQMQAGLPAIWQLAAASGEDLAMVSDIVTDSITAFGLTANDAQRYVDILAQTATNSNTDVRRMGETFKYVAPIAGTLGYSVEDTALSIGLLASAGIKGSQAGTTLRNIFTRISTNAGSTSKDLGALEIVTNKLGVSFYDAEGKARDWGDVLTEMRAAWQGMDVDARRNLIDTFNGVVNSGAEADLTLKEFAADAEQAQKILKQAQNTKSDAQYQKYAEEIGEIGHQYDELLKMLDIPIPTRVEDYANALDQARIKLGMMSDQEKIYYAKQVGSMRGMSGFLRLLEAQDEDLTKLVKSYENAAGAADAMSKTRLDNLGGDIDYLNAALDVLKIAIFDDVKGPLREVVQWGSEALNRITDAVNENGLLGGIEQLGVEIEAAGEKFAPMLESLGKAAVPFVEGLLTNVIDPLSETAVKLGSSLASGVLEGLETELDKRNLSWIGDIFGDAGRGILHWFNTDMSKGTGGLTSSGLNPLQIPEVHAETITFDGVEFTADQLREALENAVDDPLWGKQVELAGQKVSADVAQALLESLSDAGTNGGQQMGDNIFAQLNTDVPEWATLIANAIGLSGTTAGDQMDGNIYAKIISAAPSWASYISSKLGSAGSDAGNGIAGGIQRVLSATSFGVSIVGTVTNIINRFKTKKYAQATNEGRILRGATIFGYDQDGTALQGGEAGNEAIIGTQSLSRLITDAVRKGGNSSARPITINVYQQPGESAERLVSEIQREFIRIDQAARSYV